MSIDVTVATVGGDLLIVHLLNPSDAHAAAGHVRRGGGACGEQRRHGLLRAAGVPPIHDVAVMFNAHRVQSARPPLARVDLEVSDSPHGVRVPKVDLHEVLLARLA